jgi:hypothetical protein
MGCCLKTEELKDEFIPIEQVIDTFLNDYYFNDNYDNEIQDIAKHYYTTLDRKDAKTPQDNQLLSSLEEMISIC